MDRRLNPESLIEHVPHVDTSCGIDHSDISLSGKQLITQSTAQETQRTFTLLFLSLLHHSLLFLSPFSFGYSGGYKEEERKTT